MGGVVHAFLFVLFCASMAVTLLMIVHAAVDRKPDGDGRDRRQPGMGPRAGARGPVR
jgi:hypothetical protein